MTGLRHLGLVAIAAACGTIAMTSVGRERRPIARVDRPRRPEGAAGSPQRPVVPEKPPDRVREAERSRRAIRPVGDPKRVEGPNYEGVLQGVSTRAHPGVAEPMSPTYCRSVEPVPEDTDSFTGPHSAHFLTVRWFEGRSGFGQFRMTTTRNDRGVEVASPAIDRVELVGLLTDREPSVYVLDEMATPALARQARRRPLDEFERLGLEAVRRGEELVGTREAPRRMFGAIRARAVCLDCHANAKQGDLLGAFTYYLRVPVDRVENSK
jgi:hypothetical protein